MSEPQQKNGLFGLLFQQHKRIAGAVDIDVKDSSSHANRR